MADTRLSSTAGLSTSVDESVNTIALAPDAVAEIPLKITLRASHTGDSVQVNDSTGTKRAGFGPSGGMFVRFANTGGASDVPLDVRVDTGHADGLRTRLSVEYNANQATVDLNLRGVVVELGSSDSSLSAAGTQMRCTAPSGDTSNRFQYFPAGRNPDTNSNPALYLGPNGDIVHQIGGLTSNAYQVKSAGDAQSKFVISETGALSWGAGGASPTDIFLSRDSANTLLLAEGDNLKFGTTTGSKIGTGATQKIGFYGVTPVVQPAANADTSGATLAALETEVNELKATLRSLGLLAT